MGRDSPCLRNKGFWKGYGHISEKEWKRKWDKGAAGTYAVAQSGNRGGLR